MDGPDRGSTLRKLLDLQGLRRSEERAWSGPPAGEDGGAERTGVLREGGDAHVAGQGRCQGADHAGLQRYSASKADGRGDSSARQRRDALGDGVLHAGGNVGWRDAFSQQPDDLGLGKDYAHAADEGGFAAVTAEVAERGEIDAEPGGDDFKEAAAAGGTAVVHGKIPHASSVFEGDELAVLAADLDDGAGLGA